MSFYPTDVQAAPAQDRYQQPMNFKLTPEEERILKQCSKEGIIERAIPLGVAFGFTGLIGARSGLLMSKKYGVKPAVIGLGLIGYFIGRISYSRICFRRVMEMVPDGNLKNIFRGTYVDPRPDAYYLPVEVPKTEDSFREARSTTSDIDLPTMSSFDTVPSEYYETNVEKPEDEIAIKNYASYDDLRQQNRQEYSKKFYNPHPQESRYSNQPRDGPVVRRPTPQEMQPSGPIGGQRTKYGDTWDA